MKTYFFSTAPKRSKLLHILLSFPTTLTTLLRWGQLHFFCKNKVIYILANVATIFRAKGINELSMQEWKSLYLKLEKIVIHVCVCPFCIRGKRIAVLRCVSVFDPILWTRCLLQRLNVSSGFSVFKVILAFSGFNFLRLLFICFFRYNGKQFLFPCSSFQKKLQGDMRARYDISSILQCFFFFCSSLFAQLHEPNYHTRAFVLSPSTVVLVNRQRHSIWKPKEPGEKRFDQKGPFVLEAVN